MPSVFEICLTVAGVALQVYGLALAAVGVSKVRREYAPDSPSFFKESGQRLVARVRHLLGRREMQISAGVAIGYAEARGHARIGIAPLVSASTLQDQIAELDRQIRRLDDGLDRLSIQVEDEIRERARHDREVDARLKEIRETTQREISKLATDGLYEQALGLLLTLLGTVLAAVAIFG